MNTASQAFDVLVRSTLLERARRVLGAEAVPPSPCVSVCQMDAPGGLCRGCLRSIDEICRWSAMDTDGKRQTWRLIEQRCQDQALRPAA